jgi:hypothetical protein
VTFYRSAEGELRAGEAKESSSAASAERQARVAAQAHAGAVAFSRTGDPSIGEFQDAVVLAQFGDVDLNASANDVGTSNEVRLKSARKARMGYSDLVGANR